MSMIAKNTTGSAITIAGVEIAASGQYTIQPSERHLWASSDLLVQKVGSGEIVINDGSSDLSASAGLDLVKLIYPSVVDLKQKSAVTQIPKVSVHKSEGSSGSIASHDWTDPCTWYTESTRVTGETLTLDAGKTYDMANNNIIDLVHGRVSDEDDFSSSYLIKVYDNGVLKTEDTDYTVDYENGKVTFDAGYTVTGPVTADYSYESGSMFKLVPDSGKILHLEHAELQFCKNIQMNSGGYIDFDIYVYDPNDLPNKVLYKRKRYKNIKDILNSANLGQGSIPAIDGFTNDILVFPFNYVTTQSLLSSQGAELRVSLSDDTPLTGEWATATFYIMSESE